MLQAVVILLECAYIAAAIYGCTRVYMDFNYREMFVPHDSWLHKAFAVQKQYFSGDSIPFDVYTKMAPQVGQ